MNTDLYLYSRWNLWFTLTITASVSWKIQQNLTIFFVSFPVKVSCEGVFLLKLQAVFYQQFYQRWTSVAKLFFLIFDKKSRLLDGYFYLLLSLKLLSEKKSNLLKLPPLITLLPKLDQSNEIHFAASWWALINKGRCNTLCSNDISLNFNCLPLYC